MSNEHFGFGNVPPPGFIPPPPTITKVEAWAQQASASRASAQQLAAPHQLVVLTVSDEGGWRSSIGVMDRFQQMHYIAPNEKLELDLPLVQIENIREKSLEDHGRYQAGTCRPELVGKLLPRSPLRIVEGIIGLDRMDAELQTAVDARSADLDARERRIAIRESDLAKKEYAARTEVEKSKA